MFKFRALFLLSPLYLTAGCSSSIPVTELPATAQPETEITRIDQRIIEAQGRQADVLSPKNFIHSKEALGDAKKDLADHKEPRTVLHELAVADSYLDKTNQATDLSNQLIPGVVQLRRDALAAGAPQFASVDLTSADAKLTSLTRDFENNNTSDAEKNRPELEKKYSDIELAAIKEAKLGSAKLKIQAAEKNGATKLTPQTLDWAKKKISADEGRIVANRHNAVEIEHATHDANDAADKLTMMLSDAQAAKQKNPEQLASQFEQAHQVRSLTEEELAKTDSALDATQKKLANESANNEKLQSKITSAEKFKEIEKEFTPNEADIYQQGDNIVLRLKGLSFDQSKATISPKSYPLLTKVQTAIQEMGDGTIVVAGHTDSVGSQKKNEALSTERAKAVESYLVANKIVTESKISAEGYGDSKPIATNKTKEGRAQNRRVDLIFTPKANE